MAAYQRLCAQQNLLHLMHSKGRQAGLLWSKLIMPILPPPSSGLQFLGSWNPIPSSWGIPSPFTLPYPTLSVVKGLGLQVGAITLA